MDVSERRRKKEDKLSESQKEILKKLGKKWTEEFDIIEEANMGAVAKGEDVIIRRNEQMTKKEKKLDELKHKKKLTKTDIESAEVFNNRDKVKKKKKELEKIQEKIDEII